MSVTVKKALPEANSDFYALGATISEEDQADAGLPGGRGCPVADAEAIYSYEGTREMNTLIVGRAITGFSAFV